MLKLLSYLLLSLPLTLLQPPPGQTPPLPSVQTPLRIDGFAPAIHLAPEETGAWPKPVMVFLHGINANPDEQCGWWQKVGQTYGWMLCLRGSPQPGKPKASNLWTHSGVAKTNREIFAALNALKARYPKKVDLNATLLAGYSRGAILAPSLATIAPDRYTFLYLAEGGLDSLKKVSAASLKAAGVKGVALAMGTSMRRRQAQRAIPGLKAAGLHTVYVDMPGAGHRMAADFDQIGAHGLNALIKAVPRSAP